MTRRTLLASIPLVAWRSAAAAAVETRPGIDQQEQFLKSAEIVRRSTLSEGVTGSVRATLRQGGFSHDAHIQSVDIHKSILTTSLGTEINFRDTYKHNIAAYRLARLLDVGMIPPSVERRVDRTDAAVTWWVDDVLMTEKERFFKKIDPPQVHRWNDQMHVVRVFDQLIYNMDRNLGNLVINKGWDIWMIDHTRAFRLHRRLRSPSALERCDRALLEALRSMDRPAVEAELEPFLTGPEIEALLARRERIVELFDEKVRNLGENAVLYELLTVRR